jgi:K+ transporter
LLDNAFGTYAITISAALLTILITWFMDNKKIVDEINRYKRDADIILEYVNYKNCNTLIDAMLFVPIFRILQEIKSSHTFFHAKFYSVLSILLRTNQSKQVQCNALQAYNLFIIDISR